MSQLSETSPSLSGQPAKVRPGRWIYVLGVVLLVLAIILPIPGAVMMVSGIGNTLARGTVPGSFQVTFPEDGDYALFYEHRSVLNGTTFNTASTPPSLQYELRPVSGGPNVPMQSYPGQYRYTTGAREGMAIQSFHINQPGQYTLTAAPRRRAALSLRGSM